MKNNPIQYRKLEPISKKKEKRASHIKRATETERDAETEKEREGN